HGQADHRFDRGARPAHHRRLPAGDRHPVRPDQPGGRPVVLGARSAGAARRQRIAAAMSTPLQTDTSAAATVVAPAMAADQTPLRQLVTSFGESRLALAGLAVLLLLVLMAIFAPWLAPQDPYDLARLDLM